MKKSIEIIIPKDKEEEKEILMSICTDRASKTREEEIEDALAFLKRELMKDDSSINEHIVKPMHFNSDGELAVYEMTRGRIEFERNNCIYFGSRLAAVATASDGKKVYFKFSIPEEEIREKTKGKLNHETNIPVDLLSLGTSNILNYALPQYCLEMSGWFEKYRDDPAILNLENFKVSYD